MLGNLCKKYRLTIGATLREIEGSPYITALSHFESGRSSNIAHFAKYLQHALHNNKQQQFFQIITEGVNDGK